MTAIISPVRYDRLQKALEQVFSEATGAQVAWSYGPGVFDGQFPSDFINLTIAVGPIAQEPYRRRSLIYPPTVVDIAVSSVVEDQRYLIDVNDHGFYFDAPVGATGASIRAGLVAALANETLFSAVVAGTVVRLTPTVLGGIWQLKLHGPLSVNSIAYSTEIVQRIDGTYTITISVGCFSKNTQPRNGAWNLASIARAALESSDLIQILEAAELNVKSVGAGIDLSDVAGTSWQSRVSFDVVIDMPAVFTRPHYRVKSINYQGEPIPFSVAQP